MLFHSWIIGGLGPDWSWLSRFGWIGVDLFFVLSGFLIGMQVLTPLAQGKKLSFIDFYIQRAFRILPAYFAVLIIYFTWQEFNEAPSIEPIWKFITFFVNLSIDFRHNAAFSHAWSLCVEQQFYWVLPFASVLMLRKPSLNKFVVLCVALILSGILLRGMIWLSAVNSEPPLMRNWFVEDIYFPTWNRIDGLLCGVALATFKVFRPQWWQSTRRFADLSFVMGLIIIAVSFWVFRERIGFIANTVGWPILSIGLSFLVFAAAEEDSFIGQSELFFAKWVATISYSLYLIHKGIYHLIQVNFGAQLTETGVVAFMVYGCAALLAGALLHYIVERPFLRLRTHISVVQHKSLNTNSI